MIADPQDWVGVEAGRDVSEMDVKIRELYQDPAMLTYEQMAKMLDVSREIINRRVMHKVKHEGLMKRSWTIGKRKEGAK